MENSNPAPNKESITQKNQIRLYGEFFSPLNAIFCAHVTNATFCAFGGFCCAHVPAVKNQPVMRVLHVFAGDARHKLLLHFFRRFPGSKPDAWGNPQNMRIDGHCLLPVNNIQYDVSCFSAHAGKRFQFFARAGNC